MLFRESEQTKLIRACTQFVEQVEFILYIRSLPLYISLWDMYEPRTYFLLPNFSVRAPFVFFGLRTTVDQSVSSSYVVFRLTCHFESCTDLVRTSWSTLLPVNWWSECFLFVRSLPPYMSLWVMYGPRTYFLIHNFPARALLRIVLLFLPWWAVVAHTLSTPTRYRTPR